MTRLEKRSYQKSRGYLYPVNAAQKFISLFEQIVKPNEEQRSMLAAAYYTLATQQDISLSRSKMHVNSAIALLKEINIKERKENWGSQIAHAYFIRAELLEEKESYQAASLDYLHAIDALEHYYATMRLYEDDIKIIADYDRLLFARCAISISDLIVNEQVQPTENRFSIPLYYINMALEQLAEIMDPDDEIWATQAYAHQIAGIALSARHFEESKEAFHTALLTAFNTESLSICSLLADIYSCIGLLYEQRYPSCVILKDSNNLIDHAMIYFGLAMLFNPTDLEEEKESDALVLESLFEMIYRVLDPFLTPLSAKVTSDVVDALIYAYLCIIENILPNQNLANQLRHRDTLDTFAQHIYWLVIEAYRKDNPGTGLLEISDPRNPEYMLHWEDIYDVLETNDSDNVHYLEKRIRVLETDLV